MKTGKVVLGTIVGIAVGALAGVLLAPKKSSAILKKIKDKSDEFMGKLKSKFDDLFDTLTDKLENTKNDAENLAKKGKAKFNDAKKEVKNDASY